MIEGQQQGNPIRTARKLAFVAVAMFGFGYAMVPLYDVFCEVTGINGKTGAISQSEAAAAAIDLNRKVTVEFDTNINADLPWEFSALEYKKTVHPGEIAETIFVVENKSNEAIIGQAVPSVAPSKASLFFNKTECFCFTNQVLQPGERKEMVVRFVVGAELPEEIKRMTLSYTFFQTSEAKEVAGSVTEGINEYKG